MVHCGVVDFGSVWYSPTHHPLVQDEGRSDEEQGQTELSTEPSKRESWVSGSSCSSFLLHVFHRSYTLREQAGSSLHLQGSSRESLGPSSISSSCYTVNRVGRDAGEEWGKRGRVTVTVRKEEEDREQEDRRRRFEHEKEAVVRICRSSFHTKARSIHPEQKKPEEDQKKDQEGEYENVGFDSQRKLNGEEELYDQVKQLKNSVREVNAIVQSEGREGEGSYKAVLIHVRGEEEVGRRHYQCQEPATLYDQCERPSPLYDHPRPLSSSGGGWGGRPAWS